MLMACAPPVVGSQPTAATSLGPAQAETPQVFEADDFSLTFPSGWILERRPVQNLRTVLLSATRKNPDVVLSVESGPLEQLSSFGVLTPSGADAYFVSASIGFASTSGATNVQATGASKPEIVGKSLGYQQSYGGDFKGGRIRVEMFVAENNGKWFGFISGGRPESFSKPDFDGILSSLKFR